MHEVRLTVASPRAVALSVGAVGVRTESRPYQGDYEFTPNGETQIIEIAGKQAAQDIIINPIPSNYGLIAWNGAVLSVS